MFKKKPCSGCGKKLNDKYEFCPYCGNSLEDSSGEELGMLGKEDFASGGINELKLPAGLNMIFNSLMKNLNKQFNELNKELKEEEQNSNGDKKSSQSRKSMPHSKGVSISISTSGNLPPEIKVNSFGDISKLQKPRQAERKIKEVPLNVLSQKSLKKFSAFPKEEPLTNVRRLSDKVVYEIEVPHVKSMKDISIIKFEKSIEIKALAKNKAYMKIIPISLPIISCNLLGGKLILGFGTKD